MSALIWATLLPAARSRRISARSRSATGDCETLSAVPHSTHMNCCSRSASDGAADLEQQFMCVECGTALSVSQSPVAERERALVDGEAPDGRHAAAAVDHE